MNKWVRTVLSLCIAVFTMSYVGVMVYRYNYTLYKTETVFTYSMDDSYTTQAAFIRSEVVIPHASGVLNYRAANGEMVLKGAVVADVFSSDYDIERQKQIVSLEAEIANLKTAQNAIYSGINTVNAINAQAEEQLTAITSAAAYGRLDDSLSHISGMTYNMNRKQIAIGREKSFLTRIEHLDAELLFLLKNSVAAQGAVIAPETGYFSSRTDGYEAAFSTQNIALLDDEEVARLISGRVDATGMTGAGKIITTHNYYIAVSIEPDMTARFKEGTQLYLAFPADNTKDIRAVIVRSSPLENGNYLVYMRLSNINDYLLAQRTASVTIKFDIISGLRLPNSALRYAGSQAGAYVLYNGRIIFKPIDIIFEETGYVLCKPADSTDASPIRMYDQVITAGTDLYDGKVVG